MSESYSFEELDDQTRIYLRGAYLREAHGYPGIYAPASNTLPWVGCIVGIVGIIAILAATLPPFENETKVALLQTAVLLPCLWMIWAAARVWTSSTSDKYIGHFVYIDASYLWEAQGSKVTVTPIDQVGEATATHDYNDNKYQNSVVRIRFADRSKSLTLTSEPKADQFVMFCNILREARLNTESPLHNAPPMTKGIIAREMVHTGKYPLSVEGIEAAVDQIPVPSRTNPVSGNLLNYAIILLLGVGCVLLMREINADRRDDGIWETIQADGLKAPDLRAYLMDEKHTTHREDALKRLAGYYTTPITQIRQNGTDPNLKAALITILENLKTALQPAVSLRAKETRDAKPQAGLFTDEAIKNREKEVMNQFADGLSRTIGEQLIFFIAPPSEDIPSMIDLNYQLLPADQPNHYRLQFEIQIRPKPDGPVVAAKKWPIREQSFPSEQIQLGLNEQLRLILRDLAGENAAMRMNPGGGIFLPQKK